MKEAFNRRGRKGKAAKFAENDNVAAFANFAAFLRDLCG